MTFLLIRLFFFWPLFDKFARLIIYMYLDKRILLFSSPVAGKYGKVLRENVCSAA